MTELSDLTGAEAIAAVRDKDASVTEIATACLDRIRTREPVVHAFAHHDPLLVRQRAEELDRGLTSSPLRGMTLAIKDLMDTADYPTEFGSRIYAGRRPVRDAALVTRLNSAGALVMGKTVTTEFALFEPGPTTNPWDAAHTPGGSSSGSAAATADGMVAAAIGTQTAGSVIRPAAFCGVVGFKPSFGALDRAGLKVMSPSLDTLGVFARTVRDIELVYRCARVVSPRRNRPERRAGPVRIGFVRTSHWEMADPTVMHGLEALAEELAVAGFEVVETTLPPSFADLVPAHAAIMEREVAETLHDELARDPHLLSDSTKEVLRRGSAQPREAYVRARTTASECRSLLSRAFGDLDAILTPAVTGEAPRGLSYTGDPIFCRAWTLLGTPTISLPLLAGPSGLPIGVQFVGHPGEDHSLLKVASAVLRGTQH
ncbi:amidase [Nocardioides panacis]|uniref:Amidase n=1 Tax=Nocardioides panacis TaxID=2849501 RepID=A0A975Y230_9ACTN|nr:amidase [Nocardioides panacis]QWZ10132.1 amidase [Nocardioides panacis]